MKKLTLFVLLVFFFSCDKNEADDPVGTEDISMSLPYLNSAHINGIHETYSESSDCPWGFAHNGIDFFPKDNLVPIRAVAPGKVVELQLWKNDKSVNYQVNVGIKFNSLYTVAYIFEPFSDKQSDGQIQLNNISVSLGQYITEGQLIGKLYAVGNGAHLHFGLNKSNSSICPESFFSAVAKDSLLTFIHKTHPDWNICY